MSEGMLGFDEAIKQYNKTTGENITMDDVFKLEEEKTFKVEEVKVTASKQELEQLKFKVDKIMTDFMEYYAPKGRKLKATFHFIKDDNDDTYGEKVIFGDMIEVVLNIDTGTGSVEDE